MEIIEYLVKGLKHHYKIFVPIDYDIIHPKTYEKIRIGRYEYGMIRRMKYLVKPEDSIIEFGTGIGLTAIVASKLSRNVVTTVDCNPNDKLRKFRDKFWKINEVNVNYIHGAITKQKGMLEVERGDRKVAFSSGASIIPMGKPTGDFVPCLDIRETVINSDANILLADIEGSELELIETEWTDNIRMAMIELHTEKYIKIMKIGNKDIENMGRYFKDRGFNIKSPSCRGKQLVVWK